MRAAGGGDHRRRARAAGDGGAGRGKPHHDRRHDPAGRRRGGHGGAGQHRVRGTGCRRRGFLRQQCRDRPRRGERAAGQPCAACRRRLACGHPCVRRRNGAHRGPSRHAVQPRAGRGGGVPAAASGRDLHGRRTRRRRQPAAARPDPRLEPSDLAGAGATGRRHPGGPRAGPRRPRHDRGRPHWRHRHLRCDHHLWRRQHGRLRLREGRARPHRRHALDAGSNQAGETAGVRHSGRRAGLRPAGKSRSRRWCRSSCSHGPACAR